MKKIDFNDLVDIPSHKEYLEMLALMKSQLSSIIAMSSKTLKNNIKLENYAELQKQTTAIKAAEAAEISLQKVEQERIKTQIQLDKETIQRLKTEKEVIKASQEAEKATKKEMDAWTTLSKQLRAAELNYKNLALTLGTNNKQTIEAKNVALKLKQQQDGLNKSMGRYNSEVGKYSSGVQDAINKTGLLSKYTEIAEKIQNIYNAVVEISTALFKKKSASIEVNTTVIVANTTVTEVATTTEKASTVAKESETVATEANTTAQEANKLARLGWIAVAVAVIAVMGKLIFSYDSAADKLEQWIEGMKTGFKTMSVEIGLAAADYTARMQEIKKSQANDILDIAKLGAEAAEARTKAMETDVYTEKLKQLDTYILKTTLLYNIEIDNAEEVAAAEVALYKVYEKNNKAGVVEQKIKMIEALSKVHDLEREKQSSLMRAEKQTETIKADIVRDELKMKQDASKQRIEMIKIEEDKKLALNKNAYDNELAALKETQRKLGDADGTSPEHATERNVLYQKYLFDKAAIRKEANDKEIAEMQKLQDTLLAIESKTHNLDTQLIHENRTKELIASKDAHDKEVQDIEKQNKELTKQEGELYKLNATRKAEQSKKIKESKDALNVQLLASDKAYYDRNLDIAIKYADQVIEIDNKIALDKIKQQEVLLERETKSGSIWEQKDSIRKLEAKKEEEYNLKAKNDRDKITQDELTTAEYKAAKIKEINQTLANDLANIKNESNDKIKALEAKQREDALNAIEDFEKEAAEKKQRQYDREISQSQKHQDLLKEMAARGNQDAKNNLAMEEAKEIQLQAKKEKAIKNQKQIEAGLAILRAWSKNLETESTSTKALTKTLSDAAVMSLALKAFSFFEGTEDTGEGGGLDSKGGKLAILHPHERVMTAEQNKAVDGLTNWELANAGMMYKDEIKNISNEKWQTNEMILRKFDNLEKAIKDKPVYLGNEYTKDSHQLCEIVSQGNSLVRNHRTLSKLG
jgi:hypothetical protein